MAGIVIPFVTVSLDEPDFEDFMNEVKDYAIDISPVGTAPTSPYFQTRWELDVDYPTALLSNDTVYGEYLDGANGIAPSSKQAPQGLTKPIKAFAARLRSQYP